MKYIFTSLILLFSTVIFSQQVHRHSLQFINNDFKATNAVDSTKPVFSYMEFEPHKSISDETRAEVRTPIATNKVLHQIIAETNLRSSNPLFTWLIPTKAGFNNYGKA